MLRYLFVGVLSALATFICFSSESNAQNKSETAPKPEIWIGVLDTGIMKLRLKLDVTKDNGKQMAVVYSIDQGNARLKLDSYSEENGVVKFKFKKASIVFEGKLDPADKLIQGTFTQSGQPFELTFKKTDNYKPDKHIETWAGVMDAGIKKFEFQIRVFETYQGRDAKLDSFSEGLLGLPIDLSQKDSAFNFELAMTKASYHGEFSDDRKSITGKWKQRGNELDLNFKQVELSKTRDPKAKRPQTPKAPFPYKSKLITFNNDKDSVKLAGTLTIPQGTGPFPAVILISGSGGQDRNETIFEHRPFWVIADRMTRAGIAVLRYDERGIGESTGTFATVNSMDLSHDIEAGIEFLKGRDEIDAARIGLIGHSEGGYLGPMVAARNKSVAFLVSMAGSGVTGKEIIRSQSRLMLGSLGQPKKEIDYAVNLSMKMIEVVEANKAADRETLVKKMEQRLEQYVAENEPSEEFKNTIGSQKAAYATYANPWFRFFLTHDPRLDLRKVKVPVLAFCGSKDLQVDADLNLPEIEKALKEAGNQDFTIMKVEGLNHLFQKTETGRVSEYAHLEETFNEDLLETMVQWVVKRSSK